HPGISCKKFRTQTGKITFQKGNYWVTTATPHHSDRICGIRNHSYSGTAHGVESSGFHHPKGWRILPAEGNGSNSVEAHSNRGLSRSRISPSQKVGGGRTDMNHEVSACNVTTSLDLQLRKFWELEQESSERVKFTSEERACEKLYDETTIRIPDGSYQVQLPFKNNQLKLGNSKNMAYKRLSALWTKFERNLDFKEQYTQAIADFIKDGHLERVPSNEVPFGISSAPYLAKKTIQRLAKDEEKNFPRGAEVLRRDFYMDDGMTGANSTKAAINLYKELHSITSSGNFLLRKWSSSNPKVLEVIPEELRATQLPLSMDNSQAESALG
ncbi:unnamed protein product, partial [Allacma fusca]